MFYLFAGSPLQTFKWYPLLHSKYASTKPEIRLGIYIDDDAKAGDVSFKAKGPPARVGDCKWTFLITVLLYVMLS